MVGSPRPLTGRLRRALPVLLGVLLAAFIAAQEARAADITAATGVTVALDTTSIPAGGNGEPAYWNWQKATMKIAWSVPNTAVPGDTFRVAIDPDLNAASFIPFDLRTADGSVVAKASVVNDAVVFTLTDYVQTHRDVHGDAMFALEFRTAAFSETTPNYVDVYGTRVSVMVDPGPSGLSTYKYGMWKPNERSATARDATGALLQRTSPQIRWAVQLRSKVDSPARDWSTLTVVETPYSGSHFDCTVANGEYTGLRPLINAHPNNLPVKATVTVKSCAPDRVTMTVTKPRADQTIYRLTFDGWLDVDTQGRPVYRDQQGNWHLGFNPSGFANAAELDYDGWQTVVYSTFIRTDQGGTASGTGVAPRVDIEKYSNSWRGVIFRDGVPLLDESGQPAELPAEDYDAAPGKDISPENDTKITMTVTNTGTETLNNVSVVDDNETDPDLSGFVCTYKGATAMPFQGFAPGETFNCTVTLRGGFGDLHLNTATVTAVSARSGTAVSDADAFYARRLMGAPVTLPIAPPDDTLTVIPKDAPSTTPPAPLTARDAGSPTMVSPANVSTDISGRPADQPLLIVTKRAQKKRVRTAGIVPWRVTVRNAGGGHAAAVTVCDHPGPRQTVVGRVAALTVNGATRRARLTVRSGKVCVTLPRLASGQSLVWRVTTRLSAAARRAVSNTADAVATGHPRVRASASAAVVKAPRRTPVRRAAVPVTG